MPQQEEHLRDYFQLIRKHDFTLCLTMSIGVRNRPNYLTPFAQNLRRFHLNITRPTQRYILLFFSKFVSKRVLSGGVDRREMETISTRFSTESMLNTAIENLEENGYSDAAALFPPVGKLKRVLRAQVNPDSDYIILSVELTEAEGGERNAALLVNQLAKDMQILTTRKRRNKTQKTYGVPRK